MIEPNIITRRQLVFLLGGLISYLSSCQAKNNIDQTDEITRTFTHPLGSTQVPKDPQRIVALTGTIELDCLLALGIQPIAAAAQDYDNGALFFHPHFAERLGDAVMLPSRGQISLESIAALQPDFLIGTQGWLDPIYSQLIQIAPAFVVDNSDYNKPWQEYLLDIANLFDQETESIVNSFTEDYQRRIDYLENLFRSNHDSLSYSSIHLESLVTDNQIYIYNHIDMKNVLETIGFQSLPNRLEDNYFTKYSFERLDLIDSDVLFVYSYRVDEVSKTPILRQDPLLSRLKAVQADQVFIVPSPYWYLTGPLAVQWILDDLEKIVLPLL